ncbi:MAG TPA: glycosyltransferase [Verrucomicrobiae bacterium]|nr:glycosyltransferase [Verrucomicrobiae bacterium]
MALARIAIVHHHLRPGGVTRVISRTVRALRDQFAFAILSGEPAAPEERPDCAVGVVKGLGYADDGAVPPAKALVRRLRESARAELGAPPDVWHFHNHSLGKNPVVSEAVAILATEGERLLLHIHDFAEDGRPANYRALLAHVGQDPARLSAMLYPRADHVHYATINSRDRSALVRGGIPPDHVHLVHNPVEMEADTAPSPAASDVVGPRRFLYPSRAIRRKNIGELLLWAGLAVRSDHFAVTLAPQNPAQRPIYQAWVEFARATNLPVDFEVGGGARPLAGLLRESTAAVTTSVTEGFGLAFVEPLLADRPVVGRDIPEITAGLSELGIALPGLYSRLDIPIDWIGTHRLHELFARDIARSRQLFGRQTSAADVDAATAAACRADKVDFGHLDEPLQRLVIQHILGNPRAREMIEPGCGLGPNSAHGESLARNRAMIARELSTGAYAARLKRAYSVVRASAMTPALALEPDAVLDQFLDPGRFLPLMS